MTLVLLDTNTYLRLAKRIRPLLGVKFGQKDYVLTVLKDVEDEVRRSPKLRFNHPWFEEPTLGAEPLPDIDFNIFAGNALVGYATLDEVRRAVQGANNGQARMQFDDAIARIEAQVQKIDYQFQQFRRAQVNTGTADTTLSKKKLQTALEELDDELNYYLAGEYGVDPMRQSEFKIWRQGHQPFHWLVKFYHVLQQQGGFDVVIGNPPYVGYSKVRSLYTVRGYATENCANLYAFSVERALALLREAGRYGMIVPIASLATEGMRELQEIYALYRQWHSHWAVRPGKLFVGVDMNLTITLLQKVNDRDTNYTTGYRRWSNGQQTDRPHLFTTIAYTPNPQLAEHINSYPKLGSDLEASILKRMHHHGRKLRQYTDPTGAAIYYHSGGRYWRKALPTQLSSHYKPVYVPQRFVPIVAALLNSQLFYWYWISNSNCMDVVSREVLDLPVFPLDRADPETFARLVERLLASYYSNNRTRARRGELISVDEINFDVAQAKPIIDEIDQALARCYGFDSVAVDFILNYDIKYRSNSEAGE